MNTSAIENTVLECLREHYQITGTLVRLSGENLNYLLTTDEGEFFAVKIVDEDMPPEVVEMELESINHAIQTGFSLDLPRIVPNKYKNIETGIQIRKKSSYRLRLLSFVEGIPLDKRSDISTELLKSVGKTLARYNLAMQGFEHPAMHRSHRWDVAEAGRHKDKISLLEDPDKRALLEWGFDAWEQAKSGLKSVRWQFIHGDMNPENILVEGDRVTGLVDFGDACFNPLVCELAICLAYIMMDRDDPLDAAAIVTLAYSEILPLNDDELSVLVPLICGRLVSSIAISVERRTIEPDNPNWFGSVESSWALLKSLQSLL